MKKQIRQGLVLSALIWKTGIFGSLEDTTTLLNCLPPKRAAEAKVMPYISNLDPNPPTGYYAVQYRDDPANQAAECANAAQGICSFLCDK